MNAQGIGRLNRGASELRRLVFISHANPEDNEFARWLALALAREGYQVWSDVTELLGGEAIWADVEDAIRNHAVTFLFVLTRASNVKDGTLDELQLARTVGKSSDLEHFIIPLRVDDIPYEAANIAIHGRYAIDFTSGWADGFSRLLGTLAKQNVPRDSCGANAGVVSAWWRSHVEGAEVLRKEPEELLSNWFRIEGLPSAINVHEWSRKGKLDAGVAVPSYRVGEFFLSFASAEELHLDVVSSVSVDTRSLLCGANMELPISAQVGRNALTNILQEAWDQTLDSTGLRHYTLSRGRKSFYFTTEVLKGRRRLSFSLGNGLSGQRGLVGKYHGNTWHFGLSAKVQLEPILAYVVYTHVLFSDDGQTIWDSPSRLHRARRGACSDWWNDDWRDRLLAAMSWVEEAWGGAGVRLSSVDSLQVGRIPVSFVCPVSYDDDAITQDPFAGEAEDFEGTSGPTDESGVGDT
jgi:hypothetical protein